MMRRLTFLAPLVSMLFAMSPEPATSPLRRTMPGTLRVVTWNIGANSVVPSRRFGRAADPRNADAHDADARDADTRAAAFGRVMRALDADVVCLQELTIGPERAAALMDAVQPLPNGARWHAASELGNVLLSRHPLTERRGRTLHGRALRHPFSQRGHVIARVQVPGLPASDAPTIACMHLQAKGGAENIAFRVRHAEAIVHDLGRVHGPVIALGDMNAIDEQAPYLRALETGAAGSPAFPLAPVHARHNGAGTDSYTWRNDRSGYAPGVLDYILFTRTRVIERSAFVLNTMTLSEAERATSGLHAGDALRKAGEHDHLPVVADLEIRAQTDR